MTSCYRVFECPLACRFEGQLETNVRDIVFFVGDIGPQRPVRGAEASGDFYLNRQGPGICQFYLPGTYLVPAGDIAFVVEYIIVRLEIHELRLDLD